MISISIQDQNFINQEFAKFPLQKGEYVTCVFDRCNFGEVDLSDFKFDHCEFLDCNLSLVRLNQTVFRDVIFKGCKMLGLQFENCNHFGLSFSFDHCQLNHSSFFQLSIKKTKFKNCQLREVDFSETNLSLAVFDECDLAASIFDHTILEKADFRTAYNYILDPENNRIKKAKFSQSGISGLLEKYNIDIE